MNSVGVFVNIEIIGLIATVYANELGSIIDQSTYKSLL